MKLIVDRIEGSIAVCESEDQRMIEIPVSEFEFPPADGDVIQYENNKARKLETETKTRKEEVEELFRKLLK